MSHREHLIRYGGRLVHRSCIVIEMIRPVITVIYWAIRARYGVWPWCASNITTTRLDLTLGGREPSPGTVLRQGHTRRPPSMCRPPSISWF